MPVKTCRDSECKYFMQEVKSDHEHHHKCKNSMCKYYLQYVPPEHKCEEKTTLL